MPPPNIDQRLNALELNTAALFSLLGGGPDERQRFFEIVKGITSVATFQLVDNALAGAAAQMEMAHASLAAVHATAKANVA